MGCTGNCNRYGFIALVYVVFGVGYLALGNSVDDKNAPSGLREVLQAFGTIHFVSVLLCYFNRKYIFGEKEIIVHTSSWTETLVYYGGRKETETHSSTTYERCSIPFTFLSVLAYVVLFITSQVLIFISCNKVGFSGLCATSDRVVGSILIIINYIVIIATWLLLRRYYKQDSTNHASKYSETTQPAVLDTVSQTF